MTDSKHGQSESLPTTGELGGEGGSYGDAASRESRERPADGPDRVKDQSPPDFIGNVSPAAANDLRKHTTE